MKIRQREPRSSRAGSALALALIAVMTIAGLCAVLLQVSGSANRERNNSIDTLRALYIAEAGLAEAFNGLYGGKDGSVGTSEQPAAYGGGVYWVEAEEQVPGVVLLKSTGLYRSGRECLQLALELNEISPVSLGVFGHDGLEIGEGAAITMYGSADKTYAEFNTALDQYAGATLARAVLRVNPGTPCPNVGSNGDILLEDDVTVVANLVPGVNGVVVLGDNTVVTGTSSPRESTAELPIPLIPNMTSRGDLTVATGTAQVTDGYSYRLDALGVQPSASLTIRGPAQVVLDSLHVRPGGELVFDSTDGDIQIFVKGDVALDSGSALVSISEDPGDVQLLMYGTDDTLAYPDYQAATIELGATSTFFGYVYAPHSALSLSPDFTVIGGAAARQLVLEDGALIVLDYDLCNTGAINAEPVEPLSWTVQALPDVPLVKDRRDPFVQLAQSGIAPLASDLAHHVQGFRIDYVDVDGVGRVFEGAEAMFDWGAVDTISEVLREGEVATPIAPKVLSAEIIARADEIKALKETRDQTVKSGRTFWWRRRTWR